MNWTPMFAIKALVFFAVATAIMADGHEQIADEHLWAFGATYALSGVVFLLFGFLLDSRENARRPQAVKVLLRHAGKAWLLTVMRNATGELYAPADESLRTAEPVSLDDLSEDVLGCPRFKPCPSSDVTKPPAFRVLGKRYTSAG